MTITDDYINRVLAHLPPATPMRAQIALELRGHIGERVAHGQTVETVLKQLGDPRQLADSYLSAVPLEAPPLHARASAKLLDIALIEAIVLPLAALAWVAAPDFFPFVIVFFWIASVFGFCAYTIASEYWLGRTFGKRLRGLLVVRESGAPIGFGQAVVRLLPLGLQIFWIDVLFAFFTDRQQRAFELLSKTRVVRQPAARAATRA